MCVWVFPFVSNVKSDSCCAGSVTQSWATLQLECCLNNADTWNDWKRNILKGRRRKKHIWEKRMVSICIFIWSRTFRHIAMLPLSQHTAHKVLPGNCIEALLMDDDVSHFYWPFLKKKKWEKMVWLCGPSTSFLPQRAFWRRRGPN